MYSARKGVICLDSLLDQIHSPADLKRFPRESLPQLATEIRNFLVETLAETGGHLGANLGVVELTIALHYVFDSPRDRLVWDVSHQCYTHKLLTGRRDRFATLRQFGGISGFTRRNESEHDAFDAGHGGTSISAALGMARAREILGQPGQVIAVIGDGALTSGMALEALNDAGHATTNLLVVLNDNAMAISPNVGALAGYLSRLRSGDSYLRAKANFEALMQHLPGGGRIVDTVERLKAGLKQLVTPGMLFEDLGFTYLGPVEGHHLSVLINSLQQARRIEGPVLLHVLTEKGKGYLPAENHRSRLHGVTAFDIESGEPRAETTERTFTRAFGTAMTRLAGEYPQLVAITAAMCDGTGLGEFQRRYPRRFFDVGMAEEHAVTLAAGMAAEGLHPVAAIYSTFSQRAYDQLLHDVCLPKLPVILALDRAGLVGDDGPTHHGVFDLAFLRAMPNMTVMAPACLAELEAMLIVALQHDGPCAIRYPKGEVRLQDAGEIASIAEGRSALVREGNDVILVAVGSMVAIALQVVELLALRGIAVGVVNARFVKPLDEETLTTTIRRSCLAVTLEEGVLTGGFGSAVLELLEREGIATPVWRIGIPDMFVEHGARDILLAQLGIVPEKIAETISAMLPSHPGVKASLLQARRAALL